MRLLLDTNIFLWWQWRDRRLPSHAKVAIEDRENDVLVSAARFGKFASSGRSANSTSMAAR